MSALAASWQALTHPVLPPVDPAEVDHSHSASAMSHVLLHSRCQPGVFSALRSAVFGGEGKWERQCPKSVYIGNGSCAEVVLRDDLNQVPPSMIFADVCLSQTAEALF